VHGNLLSLLHFDPPADDRTILDEHERWVLRFASVAPHPVAGHVNDRNAGRRIRVGYVSPNFRAHVVAYSMIPILGHHDRDRFEVFCYSDNPTPDAITERVRSQSDVWRQTAGWDDAAFARLVRDDQIDVLVDLTLHMSNNRMLAFARKPAPVQITYVGYAATTGLPQMDYRLTDVYMDPVHAPSGGPERLLRLPHCYWAYRPSDAGQGAAVGAPPLSANGYVTFGSLNNFRKVNGGVIDAWARVLAGVPGAQLLAVLPGGPENSHVLDEFERRGVSAGRVRLLPRQSQAEYFERYGEVDISLDPFHYNGGITGLDSLWMGVPFVTLAGNRAVGRAGASLLTNVGLPELITTTTDEYVARIISLATDHTRLAELRARLRDRLRSSPLMDEAGFTRDFERLLVSAWEHWRTTENRSL
jgi:predicted O-linked N-acetylglucosamine transferase (SPINDLY family)